MTVSNPFRHKLMGIASLDGAGLARIGPDALETLQAGPNRMSRRSSSRQTALERPIRLRGSDSGIGG